MCGKEYDNGVPCKGATLINAIDSTKSNECCIYPNGLVTMAGGTGIAPAWSGLSGTYQVYGDWVGWIRTVNDFVLLPPVNLNDINGVLTVVAIEPMDGGTWKNDGVATTSLKFGLSSGNNVNSITITGRPYTTRLIINLKTAVASSDVHKGITFRGYLTFKITR